MTNVLFLDIDGVLNHLHFGKDIKSKFEFADDCVENLKKVVEQVPDLKIVISSSWRIFKTNPGMFCGRPWRDVLEERIGYKGIIIGDTPFIDNGASRAREIAAWLDENKAKLGIGTFAILDDECTDLRKMFPNNVVDCDLKTGEGLSERKMKEAVWILTDFGKLRKPDNIFFVSDTHFCHANIIKYCNRPYSNTVEMDEDLIARWNAVVKESDIVWHLGDFAFGKKENVGNILPRLNGSIRIVLGNHDHHKMSFYYDAGFKKVYDRPVLFNEFYILSHAPLNWISNSLPFANIFGHVHDSEVYKTFTARSACVCVERWNYAPVKFETLLEGMKREENL